MKATILRQVCSPASAFGFSCIRPAFACSEHDCRGHLQRQLTAIGPHYSFACNQWQYQASRVKESSLEKRQKLLENRNLMWVLLHHWKSRPYLFIIWKKCICRIWRCLLQICPDSWFISNSIRNAKFTRLSSVIMNDDSTAKRDSAKEFGQSGRFRIRDLRATTRPFWQKHAV